MLYFLDNKLGGVTSLNYNLMKHAPVGIFQEVILLDNASDAAARPTIRFPVDKETLFHFDKRSNLFHALKKLRNLIPDQPGPLIANYGMEMSMLDHFPVRQTVFQLVHDSYNLGLAIEFGHIADVFVSHNKEIYKKLLTALPERENDIFYMPHGVSVPGISRSPSCENKILNLVFLGRITRGKGIYDLPAISALLRDRGVTVRWTCIGAGPEEEAFRNSWSSDDLVNFVSPASNEEVLSICAAHDVFVLPTKFEGSPVSLLESMSVGLVPVISDLPGSIRETVGADIGFRIPLDDNVAFADAIEKLNENRSMLEAMSVRCRKRIENEFDILKTSVNYFSLFGRYDEFFRKKSLKRGKIGSRLDNRWLPDAVTRILRSYIK